MKLIEMIKSANEGNQDSTTQLISKFKPLINKYSYELKYEEANTDLIISFIENLVKLSSALPADDDDPLVIFYIHKKLYFKKIDLYRKYKKSLYSSVPIDFIEEVADSSQDNSMLIFTDLLDPLSKRMKDVILMRYVYLMTDSEIAEKFNVSRQSIHKTRVKALELLKISLDKEAN